MSNVTDQNQDSEITRERGGERVLMHPRLYEAVRNGNLHLLGELLGPATEDTGQLGERAINVAYQARSGRNIISFLSAVSHTGDTALHIAASFGHLEVARRICYENKHLLMQSNDKAETPLHYAAQAGNNEIISLFIQLVKDEGDCVAAELLRKRNRDGETALYQAIHHCQVIDVHELRLYGKFKLAHFHIEKAKGAFLKELPESNLSNHAAVVQDLVYADHDLANIPNNNNTSPLYLAIMQNSPIAAICLLGSLPDNASLAAYAGPDGQTALHAASVKNEGFVETVLQRKPGLTKSTDNSGSTPLHYATSHNNLEAVKLLLEADRASAYIADSSGLYPIHLAAKLGFQNLLAEFFKYCPDSDELPDCEGRNFLHLAVVEKKLSVVRWVCCRSDFAKAINSQDKNGNTPMHLAVIAQDLNIFALLLGTKGVNICIVNKDGMKPGDLACAITTVNFKHWQNPNYVIHRTLYWIGCSYGIHRKDHFILKHDNLLMDQDKKEEMAKNLENMAKSAAIGSTLIASAAFAGAFTILMTYKPDVLSGRKVHELSLAIKAFVLMVSYSFLCSISATSLVVEAAMSFLEYNYRIKYLTLCSRLVPVAIKGFIVAFALGVLVVTLQVSQSWRLACVVCITCGTVPVLIQPHFWPNILVQWALLKYLGIRRYTLVGGHVFLMNIAYCIIVLLVLLTGRLSNSNLVERIVLTTIIAILSITSYPFFPSLGSARMRTNHVSIIVDNRLFLIMIVTILIYLVLFFR